MTDTIKTPGVYIEEINAFPNSVVEVATAIPAFIGYTATAKRGKTNLTGVPTRISSMAEFETLFGGAPHTVYEAVTDNDTGKTSLQADAATNFLLYRSMRMFFANGGGPCWIVSIGGYGDEKNPTVKAASDFTGALDALDKEQEPTMLVAPDAVLLGAIGDWSTVMKQFIQRCIKLQSRVTLLDVYDGWKGRTYDADSDVISGTNGFRGKVTADKLSYGIAYYPWVNTTTVEAGEIDYLNLDALTRKTLQTDVAAELAALIDPQLPQARQDAMKAKQKEMTDALEAKDIKGAPTPSQQQDVTRQHNALLAASPLYRQTITELQVAFNLMPPAAAMAGVYTRIDNEFGVFKAPANTGIVGVTSPAVNISNDDQEDLNVPIEGKAVNAIRTFLGRGVLVWGARTLDGNSQDWRYVNVRRTMIMLEQSIKMACDAYVFAPNDAGTWLMVKNMIENFLSNQWKSGALAGVKPADAYDVSVGLGSTMTGNDILEGYMRVTVRVAVVRPAEFIVITFQQKMQTS